VTVADHRDIFEFRFDHPPLAARRVRQVFFRLPQDHCAALMKVAASRRLYLRRIGSDSWRIEESVEGPLWWRRNASTIAAARKAWRWCLLIPFVGSLSAGICLVNP
jgi:hypothetical protein